MDSGDGFGGIALMVAATDGYRWWQTLQVDSIGGGGFVYGGGFGGTVLEFAASGG